MGMRPKAGPKLTGRGDDSKAHSASQYAKRRLWRHTSASVDGYTVGRPCLSAGRPVLAPLGRRCRQPPTRTEQTRAPAEQPATHLAAESAPGPYPCRGFNATRTAAAAAAAQTDDAASSDVQLVRGMQAYGTADGRVDGSEGETLRAAAAAAPPKRRTRGGSGDEQRRGGDGAGGGEVTEPGGEG